MKRRDIVYLSAGILALLINYVTDNAYAIVTMLGMFAGILLLSSLEEKIVRFENWMHTIVTFKKDGNDMGNPDGQGPVLHQD